MRPLHCDCHPVWLLSTDPWRHCGCALRRARDRPAVFSDGATHSDRRARLCRLARGRAAFPLPVEPVAAFQAVVGRRRMARLLVVHLAFQHSNLGYRVGPLGLLIGVAEAHRWHHKREHEDAQVNYGDFWMPGATCSALSGRKAHAGRQRVTLKKDGLSMDYGPQLVYPSGAGQQRQTLALLAIRSCPRRILARVGPCGFLRSDRELRGVPMSRAASWRTATLACTCTCAATPRCSVWPGEPVRWRRLRRAGRPARAGSCGPRPRSHAVSKRQNRALSHDGARHVALRTGPDHFQHR